LTQAGPVEPVKSDAATELAGALRARVKVYGLLAESLRGDGWDIRRAILERAPGAAMRVWWQQEPAGRVPKGEAALLARFEKELTVEAPEGRHLPGWDGKREWQPFTPLNASHDPMDPGMGRDGVERAVLQQEAARELRALADRAELSPQQRQIFELKLRDWSSAEIAAQQGSTENAINSNWCQASKKLRRAAGA
jgi:hypothetical protein